ncbi:MAG: AAA family ATPase [Candidatus Paceibacterota bacterium]
MTQKEALEILKMGHNAFITGAAGSGKTHLLNQYIDYLRGSNADIGITASTGIAATHMGGMTIHSWSGIGIRDKISERDLEDMEDKRYLWKRLEKVKVLIIDEISMLHHFRLDLVEKILRSFKRNSEPFGGIQVVLCGDFFQLPPVKREGEEPTHFAYHSNAWKNLNLKICYLEEQYRQSDKEFLEVLNGIRSGKISEKVLAHLNGRFDKKTDVCVEPTKLYTHNINVDAENEKELQKLSGQNFEYQMTESGWGALPEILKKSCLAPEKLKLKRGARVMFVKNNFDEGYANGTLGVVADCGDGYVKVKTSRGSTINVTPQSWRIEENGKSLAEITQYPLRLAWAITVHKSQGMSLDAASVDLSKSFEKGMGYVALSRVKTLSGLSLLGLNDIALQVNGEVLEYDKKFRVESEICAKELEMAESDYLADRQNEFLEKIMPRDKKGKKKIKKAETVSETKRLVEERKKLKEICDMRGLKVDTILGHLEKIKNRDPKFNFAYLKDEFPDGHFPQIRAAFLKTAGKDGELFIAPVKTLLGDDFSYEEIRLAKLFL